MSLCKVMQLKTSAGHCWIRMGGIVSDLVLWITKHGLEDQKSDTDKVLPRVDVIQFEEIKSAKSDRDGGIN